VVVSHRYAFGMAVEVAGEDEGFERSWYSGEVLKAAAKVTVRCGAARREEAPGGGGACPTVACPLASGTTPSSRRIRTRSDR